jgi:hypothetical protein
MATLLDGITETHDGPEPRMLTADVQAVLRRVIRPGDEDVGQSVARVAERAGCSPRTVYRCLNPDEAKLTVSLGLGDALCLAAGVHPAIADVRLVWPDGRITPYLSFEDDDVAH